MNTPSFLVHQAPIFEMLQSLVVVHQDKRIDLTVVPIACNELEISFTEIIVILSTNLYNSDFFQNTPKLVVYQHSYSKNELDQHFQNQLHRSKMKF